MTIIFDLPAGDILSKALLYFSMQTERKSLKIQVESLLRELASSADEQTCLTTRVHELEKEAVKLKSRADEVTHRSKVEMATLKMDMLKDSGELERERDRQRNQVEGQLTRA